MRRVRYFFISAYYVYESKVGYCSGDFQTEGSYINPTDVRNKFIEGLSLPPITQFCILNIIELGKQDYLDFINSTK